MIIRLDSGTCFIEAGGITVFFRKARKCRLGDECYELMGPRGDVVAAIFPFDKGFKARVAELKSLGLIQ